MTEVRHGVHCGGLGGRVACTRKKKMWTKEDYQKFEEWVNLKKKYGKVVECVQCKTSFMDRNIPPVYCHGLIFCSADCCKCVHCQRGFMDMNIVPVVCHAMFFCSVECCNCYFGFVQHRWAYVPVDVCSPGQIDGTMVAGRIVVRVTGAGADDAAGPEPEASSWSCMVPGERRADRRAHREGYKRIRKAPPERVDSDDSVSSYELLTDHPCEGCGRAPWTKVCKSCKRHYCEDHKLWTTMDDHFCNRTTCREKFDRMIQNPSTQGCLRRERERAKTAVGSSGSLPPQPPSGPPPTYCG